MKSRRAKRAEAEAKKYREAMDKFRERSLIDRRLNELEKEARHARLLLGALVRFLEVDVCIHDPEPEHLELVPRGKDKEKGDE